MLLLAAKVFLLLLLSSFLSPFPVPSRRVDGAGERKGWKVLPSRCLVLCHAITLERGYTVWNKAHLMAAMFVPEVGSPWICCGVGGNQHLMLALQY